MPDVFWRDSGRPVKLVFIDGRAAWALVLLLLHWSMTTLLITLIVFGVLAIIEQTFRYTLPNARRKLRVLIWGNTKRSVSWWRTKKVRR